MCSKKENPNLREKPYIVLYVVNTTGIGVVAGLNAMLKYYLGGCTVIENKEQIMLFGHSDTLNEISLRKFYKKHF